MTPPLYQEIAESIRQAIFYGELKPGDELPPVREMSVRWNCAPGTVQRAYGELVRHGLVTSRPGQGTRVSAPTVYEQLEPLRRAALANEAEAFLLRFLSSGYSVGEVDRAIQLALDRWRAVSQDRQLVSEHVIRFVGSHEPLIARMADWFKTLAPGYTMQISFAGSLGGLIALAERKADIAGCHLWDEETDTYNMAFVRWLLPRQRAATDSRPPSSWTYACAGQPIRCEGTIRPGIPGAIHQPPAWGRDAVWLDAQLYRSGIQVEQITGYDEQVATHTEVARAITDGHADVGLGIETAAQAYGLDFHFLTNERYDLVIPEAVWASEPIQGLVQWLSGDEAHVLFDDAVGYDNRETGGVRWSDAAPAEGA
jgi:putative molybdopterin biosynthesis protein